MEDSEVFIVGAKGQLGRALLHEYPNARWADIDELDITDADSVANFDWGDTKVIINAAAYTNVDGAETAEGKVAAWKVNDEAVGYLTEAATQNDLILVHISTAYVFDGNKQSYTEDDTPNPLGEYAKSKAAGDRKAARVSKHYIVRTDSVIGEGKNFVRTMLSVAEKGISPTVVSDQIMRPTFTSELARAIKFLIDNSAPFGVYNVTNEGEAISWADFTRTIFKESDIDLAVTDTTFAEYYSGKDGVAPRPLNSVLELAKIEGAGFTPAEWHASLKEYLMKELAQ